MRMTIAAPAKINLWLRVGPPDGTGYHELSTLFCALELADTVCLRKQEAKGASTLDLAFAPPLDAPPDLGPEESNLAMRAARMFLRRAGLTWVPHIELVKRIPAGAGLGGGSSDAGSVLRALRRMHPTELTAADLLEIAAGVGSDVPFFVQGRPLALGTGRGERLTQLSPLPPRPVVLILPPFSIATREAYSWLDRDRAGESAPVPSQELKATPHVPLDWEEVSRRAVNDFEGPVFVRHPILRNLRDALAEQGARPAMLAGSGSTVFGVFPDHETASAAAQALRAAHPDHRVFLTGTRSR